MDKKIVLFDPKTFPIMYERTLPLSLLAISSFIAEEYEIEIISANDRYDYKQWVLDSVKDAICLGITSITGYPIYDAYSIAKTVKRKHPRIPIVWGGWFPSIKPRITIQDPHCDIVVRGQGERTFAELVHKLDGNLPLKNVRGITYKRNGNILENPDRPFEDVNNFPPIPFHLVNVEEYIHKSEIGSRTVEYISSQGCPRRCAFCCEPQVYRRRWSGLKPQRVVDDLTYLTKKYKIDSVIFNDDNFFVNKERVEQICDEIIENDLNIKWGQVNGHIKRLLSFEAKMWSVMKQSGLTSILVGAESGHQGALNLIKKDITVKDTIHLTKIAKSYGIRLIFSGMIGLMPLGVKPEHIDPSVDLIRKEVDATIRLFGIFYELCEDGDAYLFIYTPYPGTPLYELALRRGFNEPKTLREWGQMDMDKVLVPWVNTKYERLIECLDRFIFPFVGGKYHEELLRIRKKSLLRGLLFSLLNKITHDTSKFRLRHGAFSFPLEYKIYKTYMHIKELNRMKHEYTRRKKK